VQSRHNLCKNTGKLVASRDSLSDWTVKGMSEEDASPSISELIRGLSDESMAEHSLLLLQLLVNKAAEIAAGETEEASACAQEVVVSVCAYCLHALSKGDKSAQEVNLLLSTLANITILGEHAQCFVNLVLEQEDSVSSKKDNLSENASSSPFSLPPPPPSLSVSTTSSPCVTAFKTVLTRGLTSYNLEAEAERTFFLEGSGGADADVYWEENDPWQHTMSLLCNLSTIEEGRRVLLQQATGYMQKLALNVTSKNPCRRRGALSSIRSCLFDTNIHWWMVHEVNIVTSVLLPLVVATPFTEQEKQGMDPVLWTRAENPKTRAESIVDLVKLSLDCITLLCQTRPIREELRKRQVYPVCRNLDYMQEDEGVNSSIYEIVQFLMRDEEPTNNT